MLGGLYSAPAVLGFPGPGVLREGRLAVLGLQGLADTILEPQQIGPNVACRNRIPHAHVMRPGSPGR